jgi:hypothetical protein
MFIFTAWPGHWSHTREPSSSHAAASTFKMCVRKRRLLTLCITCWDRSRSIWRYRYSSQHTFISTRKRDGKQKMISGKFVVMRVWVHQLSVFLNTSCPMLQIRSKFLHGNSTPSLNSFKLHTSCMTLTHAVLEKRSAIEQSSRHLNEAVNWDQPGLPSAKWHF